MLSVHLSVSLSLQIVQAGRTLPWWGVKVVLVAGCMQKWEAGSWLWNCLEMNISQDNGLDSLGLSRWALAQAETWVRNHAWACDLGQVTSPLCFRLLICGEGNNPTSQGLVRA